MREIPALLEAAYRPAASNEVRSWSFGAVRELRGAALGPWSRGTLADPAIFGPTRDYECACGKYWGGEHAGIICDVCGVKVTTTDARRARMAHVNLPIEIRHPLGRPDDVLEVWPIVPAALFESGAGRPLAELYEKIVAAGRVRDVETISRCAEEVTGLLLPVATEAHRWNLSEARALARGMALERRDG